MTQLEVALRSATSRDAECLSALATQVFLETYATSGISLAIAREVESHFSVAAVRRRLDEPSHRTSLAERGGRVIAFSEVLLGAGHAQVADPRAAELTRLYVQSPFLRKGVGRTLLRHSERLASSAGASTLWLTAWVGNGPALAFYASQMYEELGTTEYLFQGEPVPNRLFARTLRTET